MGLLMQQETRRGNGKRDAGETLTPVLAAARTPHPAAALLERTPNALARCQATEAGTSFLELNLLFELALF